MTDPTENLARANRVVVAAVRTLMDADSALTIPDAAAMVVRQATILHASEGGSRRASEQLFRLADEIVGLVPGPTETGGS